MAKMKPETIKSKLNKYIQELEELKEISYSDGNERMYTVDANIKSLLRVAFNEAEKRNRDYQGIPIGIGGLSPEVKQKHYMMEKQENSTRQRSTSEICII